MYTVSNEIHRKSFLLFHKRKKNFRLCSQCHFKEKDSLLCVVDNCVDDNASFTWNILCISFLHCIITWIVRMSIFLHCRRWQRWVFFRFLLWQSVLFLRCFSSFFLLTQPSRTRRTDQVQYSSYFKDAADFSWSFFLYPLYLYLFLFTFIFEFYITSWNILILNYIFDNIAKFVTRYLFPLSYFLFRLIDFHEAYKTRIKVRHMYILHITQINPNVVVQIFPLDIVKIRFYIA